MQNGAWVDTGLTLASSSPTTQHFYTSPSVPVTWEGSAGDVFVSWHGEVWVDDAGTWIDTGYVMTGPEGNSSAPASSFTLTTTAPSSATAGSSMTVSGTYTGTAPTALTYVLDGGTSTAVASPTISSGTFSFSITAPAAGSHTLVVSSTSPVESAASVSFTTSSPSSGYSVSIANTDAAQDLSIPQTTATDSATTNTLPFVMQWDPSAIAANSSSDTAIFGKWGSAEEYLFYWNHGTPGWGWAETANGNGSLTFYNSAAASPPQGLQFFGVAVNQSAAAKTFAAFGVSVPSSTIYVFTSSTGASGSWNQVSSISGVGTSGWSHLSSIFFIGDDETNPYLVGSIYQAALGDYTMTYTPGTGFGGTILAEPPIPTAASYPVTGPDGQTWTNSGMTVVP